jgi:hypothetical protein
MIFLYSTVLLRLEFLWDAALRWWLSRKAAMPSPALSSVATAQPAVDVPVARNVIFEIGLILAAHLALALTVTVVLLT